jgi:hypothetical protein
MKNQEKYTKRDELDYIIWGCLVNHIDTYGEALKIARSLIRNGVRAINIPG